MLEKHDTSYCRVEEQIGQILVLLCLHPVVRDLPKFFLSVQHSRCQSAVACQVISLLNTLIFMAFKRISTQEKAFNPIDWDLVKAIVL